MKLIIKPGNKKTREQKKKEKCYKARCWNCGCKFIYQDEDTKTVLGCSPDYWYEVECPYCKYIQQIQFKMRCFKYKITGVSLENE